MLADHLSEPNLWIGLAAVGLFFLVMWRFRRRPRTAPLEWDFCYDYVSEPADGANPELRRAFAPLLEALGPDETAGAQLVRLAVMNRGGLRIEPEHHLRSLTVTFPADARLVAAELDEPFGPAPDAVPEMLRHARGVELAPFELPVGCALVVNMVVAGASAPQVVDGGIEGQPAIARLR